MSAELNALVADFRRTTLRSATSNGLLSRASLAEARSAALALRFEPFDLAHRGRYEASEGDVPVRLAEELTAIVSAVAGRSVGMGVYRWTRMRAGDYSLAADDEAWSVRVEGVLDVVADISVIATGEAEVVFTHGGAAYFTVPQQPGQLGIAERSPSVARYDRYLTHRVGDAVVVRLRALFA